MKNAVFTFETTHHALWAEEVAREAKIPHEMIPAPPAAHARCNIAIETLPASVEAFTKALEERTVPFEIYDPGNRDRKA